MRTNEFDEKAQEALSILMEHFWIPRNEHPRWYQLIREREKVLLRYIEEKLGFRLIIHRHFIKLEKIPVEPKPWMGIQGFQKPMDYAIFCCALAILEDKTIDEKFLLSEICEDIHGMYPGDLPLDWTNYEHRKSLIRVIKALTGLHLMETIDGETEQFAINEDQEVLYEVTVYSRYFMRSYPKDIFQFTDGKDILAEEWKAHQSDERRKRVYRRLLMSPVVYRTGQEDPDFYYIRNFRNRLREDIETHTPYRLELFKNAALLTMPERKNLFTLFPDSKAIMDIVIQFSKLMRDHLSVHEPDEFGQIRLTLGEFERLLFLLKERNHEGWSKAYREASPGRIAEELIKILNEWEMGYTETETGMIVLRPLLGRITGEYPADFKNEGSAVGESSE